MSWNECDGKALQNKVSNHSFALLFSLLKECHKLAEGLACRCIEYIFLAQLLLNLLRIFRLPLLYLGFDHCVQIF